MQKFSFIRHGETDWNVEKRIQGHTDIPLNAKGKLQAKERAKALQQEPFDVCFSSDLSRAEQTARILVEGRSIPLYLDMRLRERSHGILEGLLWHDYHAINTQERALMVESPDDVVHRLFSILDEIIHSNVLIVTHGGVMKALLHRLLASSSQDIFVSNAALLQVSWHQGNASVLYHDGIGKPTRELQN